MNGNQLIERNKNFNRLKSFIGVVNRNGNAALNLGGWEKFFGVGFIYCNSGVFILEKFFCEFFWNISGIKTDRFL